jgi:hypothetical protein
MTRAASRNRFWTQESLKQGMAEAAEAERARIVALLVEHERSLRLFADKRLMTNVIRLIEGTDDAG